MELLLPYPPADRLCFCWLSIGDANDVDGEQPPFSINDDVDAGEIGPNEMDAEVVANSSATSVKVNKDVVLATIDGDGDKDVPVPVADDGDPPENVKDVDSPPQLVAVDAIVLFDSVEHEDEDEDDDDATTRWW